MWETRVSKKSPRLADMPPERGAQDPTTSPLPCYYHTLLRLVTNSLAGRHAPAQACLAGPQQRAELHPAAVHVAIMHSTARDQWPRGWA